MISHHNSPCFSIAAFCRVALVSILLLIALPDSTEAQKPSSLDIDRGHSMLSAVKEDLKKNYYDPNYHGMDLDARFKVADDKIKQATSVGHIFGIIAQTLLDLNDSHTFFIPPERSSRFEYGWQVQMVGDKAFVVAVKPGSDAEAKELNPGDQVISVDGVTLTRKNLWIFKYLFNALRPQPGMRVQLLKPDQRQVQIDVMAKVRQGKRVVDLTGGDAGNDIFDLIRESENDSRLWRNRYVEISEDLFVWKMPEFDMSKAEVDSFVGKFRKRQSLILDLRGNGGGHQETLLRLLGSFFDHDVKVGDLKKPQRSEAHDRKNSRF